METMELGKTGLVISRMGFGALPVQRCSTEDGVRLIRRAYENGVTFFDTANAYTDSETKLGLALSDVRSRVVIATKSAGKDYAEVTSHIQNSLRALKTDYIDLFQFHNPAAMPTPDGGDGRYAAALDAKKKGYIRHIGISEHRIRLAFDCVKSGLFETLQYPFSYIAADQDIELVNTCLQAGMGYIAMKGLAGGMLQNAEACWTFMRQFPGVVPIWGIQHEWELDQWLELEKRQPPLSPALRTFIEKEKKELAGDFCRSCGYCLPCPAGIDIPQSGRMAMLLRRSPYRPYMSDEWHEKMHRIDHCLGCGACKSRCPYGLDTPNLLKTMLADYDKFYAEHKDD